jgi:hypothetical protein
MTTIAASFDDTQKMDEAVDQLAAAGFETTVYDEAAAAAAEGTVNEIRPVFPPGSPPTVGTISNVVRVSGQTDPRTRLNDFKTALERFDLSAEVIEAYGRTFAQDGKFVLLRTDRERAEQAMSILRSRGASVVDRHD